MEPTSTLVNSPDVQAQKPTVHLSLSRVGVTNVEKVIRISRDGREELYWANLECFVDLGPAQKGAHMSRFEETVNEVIGEVILGSSAFRAEELAQRIAELVRERQDARRAEVTIAARYPEHKPAPVSGIQTQELYTLFGTAVATARRHPPPDRRRGPGHDRLPLCAATCCRSGKGASDRGRLRRRPDRADLRPRPGGDPQPARPRHPAHRLSRRQRHRRRRAAADRRGVDVLGDLRDDEALRRGRRRREGPPPPALRRGLRPRDGQGGRRAAAVAHARTPSSPPARRTWRPSTSTTSSPSASACSPSSSTSWAPGATPSATRRCASGWTTSSPNNSPRGLVFGARTRLAARSRGLGVLSV